MWRATMILAGMATVLTWPTAPARGQTTHLVEGTEKGGANVWKYKTDYTNEKSKLGTATDRLRIPVKNGDTVRFTVTGDHKHGVVFENAKDEQGSVWTVTAGPLSLMAIDGDFKDFDPQKALTTDKTDGDIISIKVSGLKRGDKNGILFGCNPHSKSPIVKTDPLRREMLAVIVLDE